MMNFSDLKEALLDIEKNLSVLYPSWIFWIHYVHQNIPVISFQTAQEYWKIVDCPNFLHGQFSIFRKGYSPEGLSAPYYDIVVTAANSLEIIKKCFFAVFQNYFFHAPEIKILGIMCRNEGHKILRIWIDKEYFPTNRQIISPYCLSVMTNGGDNDILIRLIVE